MFKSIPEFPGYEINDQGVIIGLKGYALKPSRDNKDGKLTVQLYNKNGTKRFLVHCLVAEVFLGVKADGKKIATTFKDGNTDNCSADNLSFSSFSVICGGVNVDTETVKRLKADGLSNKAIARTLGSNHRKIGYILKGKNV